MIARLTRYALLMTLVAALSACRFTPFETDPNCSDQLSANFAQLQKIEARNPDPDRFTVALITDIHVNLTDLSAVVNRINARHDVDFVMITGDSTNSGLAIEYEWICNLLTELDAPRFYVIGNHDSLSFGVEIFQDNFAPLNYSFSFGSTRFVMYNDNAFEFRNVPNFAWMEAAAAVAPGEFRSHTIAVAHSPPTKDSHTEEEAIVIRKFLSDIGFDYSVYGHRHLLSLNADENGLIRYVGDDIAGAFFGLMTVNRNSGVDFQKCRSTCSPIFP